MSLYVLSLDNLVDLLVCWGVQAACDQLEALMRTNPTPRSYPTTPVVSYVSTLLRSHLKGAWVLIHDEWDGETSLLYTNPKQIPQEDTVVFKMGTFAQRGGKHEVRFVSPAIRRVMTRSEKDRFDITKMEVQCRCARWANKEYSASDFCTLSFKLLRLTTLTRIADHAGALGFISTRCWLLQIVAFPLDSAPSLLPGFSALP